MNHLCETNQILGICKGFDYITPIKGGDISRIKHWFNQTVM